MAKPLSTGPMARTDCSPATMVVIDNDIPFFEVSNERFKEASLLSHHCRERHPSGSSENNSREELESSQLSLPLTLGKEPS